VKHLSTKKKNKSNEISIVVVSELELGVRLQSIFNVLLGLLNLKVNYLFIMLYTFIFIRIKKQLTTV